MAKKGRSEPGIFGGINHYDEHGNKTGHSEPGLFGGYDHYDSRGHKVGHTDPGLLGGYVHYDSHGKKTGRTDEGLLGGYVHYDEHGNPTGSTEQDLFGGGYTHTDKKGCYVATCVYGSYDCPEVWTLRRFRDQVLARSRLGRGFIRLYYALSSGIVRRFGTARWFQKFWRRMLDPLVSRLRERGVSDTPYRD